MATPSEKLAQSLVVLSDIKHKTGKGSIRAKDLTRTHRERLLKNGFIQEVIKGWYVPSRPDDEPGDSTPWIASFWNFCADYLGQRFGEDWCVSPEQSISIHSGNWTVPGQLLVRSPKANNNITELLYETSILDTKLEIPTSNQITTNNGIRILKLPTALIACSATFFKQSPIDARAVLGMIKDSSDILKPLLDGGHTTIAGRLSGAFRNIGKARIADEITSTMKSAGYDVRETDPFDNSLKIELPANKPSPYVLRIKLIWQEMRTKVLEYFPKPPGQPGNIKGYIKQVEDIYKTDAYHSLSIEGYQVSEELIDRVRSGNWNPEVNKADKDNRDALAARGYWQAFNLVKNSIEKILHGQQAGKVDDDDHGAWYRELFAPSVITGILKASDLAGYRTAQVYIRKSNHVPLNAEAVRDAMSTLFNLLREEKEPSVRAVLGHFVFVYIHPYMDGNGRIARFLMNTMLASGGYPWTVIQTERRTDYMEALEHASVQQNIEPFAKFIAAMVEKNLATDTSEKR